MIILGIDPGLARVGWGVIRYEGGRFQTLDYGCIETRAGLRTETRLCEIYEKLADIIEKYRPDEMAVEKLYFNTNQTTAIDVAQARGVLVLCARQRGVRLAEYTPLQVKQAVAGYGRAEKRQVIMMVTSFLSLKEPPKPDDTADALAIAICHAHTGSSALSSYLNAGKRR